MILLLSSYLGRWFWLCDMLSNFRLYYVFISIIFLLFALIFKNKICILLLVGAVIIQGFTIYQSYRNPLNILNKETISEEISLLQYNVLYSNNNHKEIVTYLIENQADLDIIFLQEVMPDLKDELKRIENYFPYKVIINEPWYGRAFYSKIPILSHEIKFFNNEAVDTEDHRLNSKDNIFPGPVHYLVAHLKTKEQEIPITFYGIHTTSPFPREYGERRNNELNSIAKRINQDVSSKHKILAGDFNINSFSYWYKLLEKSTGLISSERGTGINNSWPTWMKFNLLRISIDNALVSKNILVKERVIGKDIGSDHLPVILKLDCIK